MATAIKKLHDDFLSCNICTELYEDPCTLACGHTFCRGCLARFTKTQQDAIKAKSISCPNCRQMTKKNPGRPLEDWVKQIKPTFLIQGLLDSFATQTVDTITPENPCFSCLQHDVKTSGTSHCMDCDVILCDKCVKTHRALPGTSNHVIADLGGKVKMRRKRMTMCKSHNCAVEFLCRDCRKTVCQKCAILHHRKCDNVVTIESLMSEMKSVLEQNKDILKKQFKQTESVLMENKAKITEIEVQKAQVNADISNVCQKALNLINQKKWELTEKLDHITERQIGKLEAQNKTAEIDMQMYQQHCEFIEQALTNENETDVYEIYQMCQSGAVRMSAHTDADQEPVSVASEITFEEEFDQQRMKNFLQLGRIKILDTQSSPTLMYSIDTSADSDQKTPDPVDVTVLDMGGKDVLVVTDYENACLKSFYSTDKRKFHSSLNLQCKPWSVRQLYDRRVVVSFYSHNEIVIVKVTPQLFLVSNIVTGKKYRCVTMLTKSTLVAGCHDPPSLDILDMAGRVLKSIIPGRNITQRPSFLCTTHNGNILVSDEGRKSIYCLTPEGDVVVNCLPHGDRALAYPRGITTLSSGTILVADNSTNKVVQLTSTGYFVRDLLTSKENIIYPYGIFHKRDKLYVIQAHQLLKVFRVNIMKINRT